MLDRLRGRWVGLSILVVVYCIVVFLIPKPAAVKPEGWRLTGIFVAMIAGLALQPFPPGVLMLAAIVLVTLFGGLTIGQALGGYADTTAWLVVSAFMISRALIDTGLARRIALFFVRLFGHSSLGVAYALTTTDLVLASMIPSNAARSGGVILPIARSIADIYGSAPGPTAALLGSFLMTAVYQGICVTTSMFLTGQASNALAAQLVTQQFGYTVTWSSWLVAGIVPGICAVIAVPWVVHKLNPPVIQTTPAAAQFARQELDAMGPLSRHERILTIVFAAVCGLWVTTGFHGLDVTLVALAGAVMLLLTGVLRWEQVKQEHAAWDVFIWFGGLLRLGRALNDTGVPTEFARNIGAVFGAYGWVSLFVAALLIYFYAHYFFASISAHILAMLPPFVLVLIASGAPKGLVVYAFICFSNFSAGLTNYGTIPAPLFFAHGYVSLGLWWKIGFIISLVNLTIWSAVGFTWWKIVGFW